MAGECPAHTHTARAYFSCIMYSCIIIMIMIIIIIIITTTTMTIIIMTRKIKIAGVRASPFPRLLSVRIITALCRERIVGRAWAQHILCLRYAWRRDEKGKKRRRRRCCSLAGPVEKRKEKKRERERGSETPSKKWFSAERAGIYKTMR